MQDPYFAVKEEVEHSVAVVLDLHKRWKELSAAGAKGDEFDWTTGELLSGLRSIEMDLQDLEDTVSIVEGNREKFQLEQKDVDERKHFIESTRKRIDTLRDEVQGSAMQASPGFSTAKTKPSLPSIGKKAAGYGKVGSQDDSVEMMPVAEGDPQIGGSAQRQVGPNQPHERARDPGRRPRGRPRSAHLRGITRPPPQEKVLPPLLPRAARPRSRRRRPRAPRGQARQDRGRRVDDGREGTRRGQARQQSQQRGWWRRRNCEQQRRRCIHRDRHQEEGIEGAD